MIRKHMISIAMIMPILLAALTAVPIHAQSDPTLFIDPATSNEGGPPAMVSVNVDLTAQSGVQAYDFAITYDNSVLSVASMNTGPSFSSAFIFDSSVNEGAGFLTFGAALPGSTVDITTSDILASVTFNVIGFGKLPCLVFKVQIAEIFVHHFFSFLEIAEPCFLFSVRNIGDGGEDVNALAAVWAHEAGHILDPAEDRKVGRSQEVDELPRVEVCDVLRADDYNCAGEPDDAEHLLLEVCGPGR